MLVKNIIDEYYLVAKELFKKNFLNIGKGSLSLKIDSDKMILNREDKHVLEDNFASIVSINEKNLSWKDVTQDVSIHAKIFQTHLNVKAIAEVFPVNTITYSMSHTTFKPIDFTGKEEIGSVEVIEIQNKEKWRENKEHIITKALSNNPVVIVRGYGVFLALRDIREILQKAIILENSAYILLNSQH